MVPALLTLRVARISIADQSPTTAPHSENAAAPSTQPASVPELVRQLQHGDPDGRRSAAAALGKLEEDATPAVEALTAALDDSDGDVHLAAATALGEIGPAAKSAVPALLRALQRRSVEMNAANALGEIKSDPGACVPALIEALKRGNANAAGALGGFGPDAKDAVAPLIAAVQSDNGYLQSLAAGSLGQIGPDAAAAAPALAKLVSGQKIDVFIFGPAVAGLSGIGKAGLPALIELLKNGDNLMRLSVSRAMRPLKGDAADAVPILTEWLSGTDEEQRLSAATTLAHIGPPAKAAVPALLKVARSSPWVLTQQAAANALYSIDPEAAKKAAIDEPVTDYTVFIQHEVDAYKKKELSVRSDNFDGPMVLWVNGDPVDFYKGSGEMKSLNTWLRPGNNELTFSGAHQKPVYALVAPDIANDFGTVIGQGAFPAPGSSACDRPFSFPADKAAQLPERDSLTGISHQTLQKEVEQQLGQIVDLVRAHRGKEASEVLYAGERLWSKPASGESDKDLQDEIAQAAANLSSSQTTIDRPQAPISILVGEHGLMAFVDQPKSFEDSGRPLLALKNGKQDMTVPYLLLARYRGKMIVWAAPGGVTVTLSAAK